MTGAQETPVAVVDHNVCAGVAMCLQLAPGAFELDDEGQAVFRATGDWTASDVRQAAEGCPMEAITLRRNAGG
jgi:ferredoxin